MTTTETTPPEPPYSQGQRASRFLTEAIVAASANSAANVGGVSGALAYAQAAEHLARARALLLYPENRRND